MDTLVEVMTTCIQTPISPSVTRMNSSLRLLVVFSLVELVHYPPTAIRSWALFLTGLRKEREGSNEQDGLQQGNHCYRQKRQVSS